MKYWNKCTKLNIFITIKRSQRCIEQYSFIRESNSYTMSRKEIIIYSNRLGSGSDRIFSANDPDPFLIKIQA